MAAAAAAAGRELTLIGVVRVNRHVRSSFDRRVFVDVTVVAYRGADGEYRKSFETRRGQQPQIPAHGSSASLNAVCRQWGER